jgi:hypothetical protein
MSTIQPNIEQPVSEEMQLVRRAKRGDVQAFEELVRRYDRNVFRIAQHITQNREDAVEVLYLASPNRGKRSIDEVASQEAGTYGFPGRRCKD